MLATIDISNAAAFTAGPTTRTIATFASITSDTRLLALSLGTGNERFHSTEYIRVAITSSVPFTAGNMPQIGEVILARRRQMSFASNIGDYDDFELRSAVDDNEFPEGNIQRETLSEGQQIFRLALHPHGADSQGLNMVDELRSWYRESRRGTRNFVYIDKPSSNASAWWWMISPDASMRQPLKGWAEREFKATLIEQGPFYDVEVNG
jgi:hypothetical protein